MNDIFSWKKLLIQFKLCFFIFVSFIMLYPGNIIGVAGFDKRARYRRTIYIERSKYDDTLSALKAIGLTLKLKKGK